MARFEEREGGIRLTRGQAPEPDEKRRLPVMLLILERRNADLVERRRVLERMRRESGIGARLP